MITTWSRARRILGLGVACASLATCGTGSHRTGPPGPPGEAVVVASFNFPESELVAEIYAQALEHAGVPVRRELDLGPRELVEPALQQGLVDVVPEYAGTALTYIEPNASVDRTDTVAVRAELARTLNRWHLEVLGPSPAQNQNGLVVSPTTAGALGLRSVSDLRGLAAKLTLGGPAECPSRPFCLPGYETVYGLHFKSFVAFDDEQQRVAALDGHVIDVAVMFTTDAALATGDVALLTDDRHLQPAENLVPVVSARAVAAYGSRVVDALDQVSSRLSTTGLAFLNWRIGPGHKDPVTEARGWLERQGLIRGAG